MWAGSWSLRIIISFLEYLKCWKGECKKYQSIQLFGTLFTKILSTVVSS